MAIWNSPAFSLVNIGAFLAVSIVGLTWVGKKIDGHYGTEPAFALVFLVLGLLIGFYYSYIQLRAVMEQSRRRELRDRERRKKKRGGGKPLDGKGRR